MAWYASRYSPNSPCYPCYPPPCPPPPQDGVFANLTVCGASEFKGPATFHSDINAGSVNSTNPATLAGITNSGRLVLSPTGTTQNFTVAGTVPSDLSKTTYINSSADFDLSGGPGAVPGQLIIVRNTSGGTINVTTGSLWAAVNITAADPTPVNANTSAIFYHL